VHPNSAIEGALNSVAVQYPRRFAPRRPLIANVSHPGEVVTGIEWGSIADWVSGIGSFAAAIVALYVAHSAQRVKLRGYCGHRLILGPGQSRVDVFAVSVTNISQRPTIVTNIGFTFGVWRWKRYGIITFMQDQFGHGIPKPLSDGEAGNWNVPLGPDNRWLRELAKKFPVNRWAIITWRVQVHTSNGGTATLRPEKNIREMLLACSGSHASTQADAATAPRRK